MYRDALIFNLNDDKYLVTTCDSCGSIGEKSGDALHISADIVGHLTAKVAIMEALCLNAIPTQAILSISNESNPTANKIIKGVKNAISEFLLEWQDSPYKNSEDFPILISTETNMPTSMTALGVVINAISTLPKLNMPQIGDNIYMLGLSYMGEDVIKNKDKILNIQSIKHIIQQKQVRQIIPAGSGGINAELLGILNSIDDKNIKFNINEDKYSDILSKSAGPATSALVFAPTIDTENINIPIIKIGNVESL